jgi:hypothetical protein
MITLPYLGAENPNAISGTEVDQSVVAVLTHQGAAQPKVISHIDLMRPFGTVTQWTFVAVQEGGPPPTRIEEQGPILVCLVKSATPDCAGRFYQHVSSSDQPWFDTPYHLLASSVVYASGDKSNPLLLVKVCTAENFNGDCGMATALYRYDRRADHFIRVFLNVTGRNNNQATRFVECGPLEGDVIVDYPTEDAPYTYWVEVYRAGESGQYVRILRYRGRTGYGDGNPLAVADSEMPEILRHLGLWQSGDALPIPAHLPQKCSDLFMRNGEEWCK